MVIAVVAVLAVVAGGVAWRLVELGSAKEPVAAPPPVPVTAAVATSRDVPAIVTALGTVQSIDTVNVTPRVNGRIEGIYFKQGDEVAKGQKLFLLNPRPYQAALDQAKGQLAHDQAALTEAKMDLARYHRLLVENSIAAQTEQDQADLVGQDEGTVKQDEANVAAAALNLSYCQIDAPITGRTGALQVDLGNYVQAVSAEQSASTVAGVTPLVTITQMKPIYVSFSVPQTELETIRENQAKGALTVEAYSQAGQLLATGKLSLINNVVNTTTGTIMLQASDKPAQKHEC
jgi:multidrug efflux system membrane fusion protein